MPETPETARRLECWCDNDPCDCPGSPDETTPEVPAEWIETAATALRENFYTGPLYTEGEASELASVAIAAVLPAARAAERAKVAEEIEEAARRLARSGQPSEMTAEAGGGLLAAAEIARRERP